MAESDDSNVVVRRLRKPKDRLEVNFATWRAGNPIHRLHSAGFTALRFNPGKGSSRFSPLGNGVPTLYGGANIGVAVMETLFHDLPQDSAGVPFDLARLDGVVHSVIIPGLDLNLVDLNPKTLRKLGVRRSELLDSSADQYVYTREYALAIYLACPEAHGLQWSSRQHGETAVMLFGDRVRPEAFTVTIESQRLLGSDAVMEAIEEEADQLGIVLIEPCGGFGR